MEAEASTFRSPELMASLAKHNDTFTTLLSLIPSRYYIALNPEEADSKWMKNKKRKTGEEIKEHKRRAKHEKLDPENNKTTADLLSLQTQTQTPTSAITINPAPTTMTIQPLPPTSSISDLRTKLQSRLESFRKDRGLEEGVNGAGSREALERERRERRGEIRDKRRKGRKEERKKGEGGKLAKTQLIVPELPRSNPDPIAFNPLNLPSISTKSSKIFKPISNPSQALSHLEKHKEKLSGMPAERRQEALERERWAKAEERAGGGKVADEVGTLKKAVRRLEKGKAKSGKEWSERKKTIEKSNAVSIKKRNDNIAARNEARKNKKKGIKVKDSKGKKGRPGFEGGKKGKGKKP